MLNLNYTVVNRDVPMKGSKLWMARLDEIIEERLDDASFKNEEIAAKMDISERHLFRKVNAIANISPKKYLRKYRLRKAMKYLKIGKYRSVKETAYAVGFINVSYFIRQFEKEYDRKPLKILQEAGWR